MFLTPMLAASIAVVPSDPGFVMEPKYDGWRAICAVTDEGPASIHGPATRSRLCRI